MNIGIFPTMAILFLFLIAPHLIVKIVLNSSPELLFWTAMLFATQLLVICVIICFLRTRTVSSTFNSTPHFSNYSQPRRLEDLALIIVSRTIRQRRELFGTELSLFGIPPGLSHLFTASDTVAEVNPPSSHSLRSGHQHHPSSRSRN